MSRLTLPLLTPDEVAAWREDLAALVAEIERVHPNPYWRTLQADFAAQVAEIDAALSGMTRTQIISALTRLVNSIDGHTLLPLEQPGIAFRMAPLLLFDFDDGLYILEALPPYEAAARRRVAAIGGHPVDEAVARVLPYVPHDNAHSRRRALTFWLTYGDLLHGVGLTPDPDIVPLTLDGDGGPRAVIDVQTIPAQEFEAWAGPWWWGMRPERETPLFVSRHLRDVFWFTPLPEHNALYVQYNRILRQRSDGLGIQAFADAVEDAFSSAEYDRVVLDMRHNPGGDNTTFGPLLRVMQRIGDSRPGQLVAIVGRYTFSAAMNFVTELERTTDITFVGERTGGSPNLYGDTRPVSLPNSGIEARISSRYWEKSTPDDTRDAITPEIAVPVLASDWFGSLDPALDAALDARRE